ncbi:MAG: glycosyltransferase family 4 protein [Candidatus Baltobacteraceae bacterium]|jgi:glycosyltransferase involved in cell wall biosynthesis
MRHSALQVVAAAGEHYEIEILAGDREEKAARPLGAPMRSWKPAGAYFMLRAVDTLRKEVKRFDPDLIHAFGFPATIAALGSVSRMMAARTLVSLHDPIPEGGGTIPKKFVEKRMPSLLAHAGFFICAYRSLAESLLTQFGVEQARMDTIPPGLPPARMAQIVRVPGRVGPRVGFWGQLGPDNAWEIALRALAKARVDLPHTQLWIAGGGTLVSRVRARAEELKVRDDVHLIGDVDVRELFGQIDMLLVPLARDPLPVALLDALAAGVPVVAANRGALADIVGERETGWLAEPDSSGLAAGIKDLWQRVDEAWRGAAAQRAEVAAEFDRDTVLARTFSHYARLLSEAAAPSAV